MEQDENRAAEVFKALSDENRVRILRALADGERSAEELLSGLYIAQSTLSHHMKILTDAGLVKARKKGKHRFYSLSREGIDAAAAYLRALVHTPFI